MNTNRRSSVVPKNKPGPRYLLVAVVILLGLVLSFLSFTMVRGWEQRMIHAQLDRVAASHFSAINRSIHSNLSTIQSLAAFYASSQEVEREEFQEFVRPFLVNHPGTRALQWAPRIPVSRRKAYEEATRLGGFPAFQITEQKAQGERIRAAKREEYFPVHFAEPFESNELALGLDLASNSLFKEALNRSRDTGKMVASAWIRLEHEPTDRFGFRVFLPIYRKDAATDSVVSRREYLEGFVFGVFSVKDIVNGALGNMDPAGIDILLRDLSAPGNERFLYSCSSRTSEKAVSVPSIDRAGQMPEPYANITFDVAGRKWSALCNPRAEFVMFWRTWRSWGFPLIVLLCSGFLAAFLYTDVRRKVQLSEAYQKLQAKVEERRRAQEDLKNAHEKLEESVRERTAELMASNRALKAEIEERRRTEESLSKSREEFRNVSKELNLGLSEVFDALNELSSGNPDVRIDETSELELLSELKREVNRTAENLSEIVDLSHEFAMGLAEHFDVLNRVDAGDLTARISGASGVELLESLGKVTNQMIGGVSTAMAERKRAEKEAIRRNKLLRAINKVQQETLICETHEEVAQTCLTVAEELTGSQFGYIGELNPKDLFDTIAISNSGWDACKMPDSGVPMLIKNMELRGVDRSVLREEKPRIVNEPYSHPDRVGTPEGHPVVTSFLGVPLKDAGRTIGMIGLANKECGYDLGDQETIEALCAAFVQALNRKRAEQALRKSHEELEEAMGALKETQAHMIQSEKMASIGQLAAGVAHEINNPTGFVSSNLNTLVDYQHDIGAIVEEYRKLMADLKAFMAKKGALAALPERVERIEAMEADTDLDFVLDDSQNLIKESREGTERIRKIVADLKDFAHPGQDKQQSADINECLESTLNVVSNELKYKCTVTKEFGELPLVQCYPQQLNQVFMNLLVNAAQAIEKKGAINIKTSANDGHVEIRIIDTGSGIAEEDLGKIFDPFFTTKEIGSGTGLGLNISYNIIDKHNGTIKVDSAVGEGTTFTIQLPFADGH